MFRKEGASSLWVFSHIYPFLGCALAGSLQGWPWTYNDPSVCS